MNGPDVSTSIEDGGGATSSEEARRIVGLLKDDINKFLWTRLPEDTTLCEAEDIASNIFDLIGYKWEKHLL